MAKTNKKKDTKSKKVSTSSIKNTKKTNNSAKSTTNYNTVYNENTSNYMEDAIDNSMRLFGLPHQFIDINDPRIGSKSNLGRCFDERLVMEEHVIC